MMTSSARAQTNRENAQHSTGPKGEEGKQIAAMNGFKHGLTGQRMILQNHEVDAYRRLGSALQSDYKPQNEVESQLVQHIIDCNMRLNRAAAIDSNLLNFGLAKNTNEWADDGITESVVAQACAWVDQADSLEKLGRYEARISRQLLQYTRELDRVQSLRKSTEAPESTGDNNKLASFRRKPLPELVPRFVTAVILCPDPYLTPLSSLDNLQSAPCENLSASLGS